MKIEVETESSESEQMPSTGDDSSSTDIESSDVGRETTTTTQASQQQERNNLMQIDQVFEELLAKMEVLSVQNHYQGQYGVIGSNKDKDWTSPLTPPPPPPPFAASPIGNSRSQQQQQHLRSNATSSRPFDNKSNTPADELNEEVDENNDQEETNVDVDVDVVDGRFQQNSPQQQHFYHHNQHAHHHHHHHHQFYQHQQEKEKLHEHQEQHLNITKLDAATMAAVNAASGGKHGYAAAAAAAAAGTTTATTYNNNLFYCDPSPADDVTSPTIAEFHFGVVATSETIDEIDEATVQELSQRLQAELRAAKSRHLACTEVSLPWDLMPRIAREIIKTSEREPCGVRGCSIFIEFEDEPNNTRRIASFKVDPDTVSTFELYLTLKQDRSGWTSFIPQFLRNLTRSSTILISPDFTLTKNKLYSCE